MDFEKELVAIWKQESTLECLFLTWPSYTPARPFEKLFQAKAYGFIGHIRTSYCYQSPDFNPLVRWDLNYRFKFTSIVVFCIRRQSIVTDAIESDMDAAIQTRWKRKWIQFILKKWESFQLFFTYWRMILNSPTLLTKTQNVKKSRKYNKKRITEFKNL